MIFSEELLNALAQSIDNFAVGDFNFAVFSSQDNGKKISPRYARAKHMKHGAKYMVTGILGGQPARE